MFYNIFRKKPEDWTIEEAFKNRDKSIMDCAVGSDEYAEMLSNEVYDRLLIYIVNGMFDTSNKIKITLTTSGIFS